MRLLLDTHAFLWFITADPKLSPRAEGVMRDGRTRLLLSIGLFVTAYPAHHEENR
jgi:PIN domain nuclease of toxin-antitoxin system